MVKTITTPNAAIHAGFGMVHDKPDYQSLIPLESMERCMVIFSPKGG